MIGIHEFVLPLVAGENRSAYSQPALENPYLIGARAQGGLAGFMHPYTSVPRQPSAAAATLVAVDAALGLGDYYDIGALYSDEIGSASFYYRLLNVGFRIPATAGTDQFSDVWRDPPAGSDRTFAHVDGPLTVQSWMAAVKRGRTFMSTGPLMFIDVDGRQPGDEISVAASGPQAVHVKVDVTSIAPVDSLQIVVNGDVVKTVTRTGADSGTVAFDGQIPMPEGGWIAARHRREVQISRRRLEIGRGARSVQGDARYGEGYVRANSRRIALMRLRILVAARGKRLADEARTVYRIRRALAGDSV